jgi:hypothetical protein
VRSYKGIRLPGSSVFIGVPPDACIASLDASALPRLLTPRPRLRAGAASLVATPGRFRCRPLRPPLPLVDSAFRSRHLRDPASANSAHLPRRCRGSFTSCSPPPGGVLPPGFDQAAASMRLLFHFSVTSSSPHGRHPAESSRDALRVRRRVAYGSLGCMLGPARAASCREDGGLRVRQSFPSLRSGAAGGYSVPDTFSSAKKRKAASRRLRSTSFHSGAAPGSLIKET